MPPVELTDPIHLRPDPGTVIRGRILGTTLRYTIAIPPGGPSERCPVHIEGELIGTLRVWPDFGCPGEDAWAGTTAGGADVIGRNPHEAVSRLIAKRIEMGEVRR